MFAMFLSMKGFQFSSVLPWHKGEARFQWQKMRNHANNVNTLSSIFLIYHEGIELKNELNFKKDYTDIHVEMKTNVSAF